jgi:hydroxypyruvate isomerase
MNRRRFSQLTAAALFANAFRPIDAQPIEAKPAFLPNGIKFSFMLWALAKEGSFDRCLEMVAEAGYNGVELVTEFQKWSSEETRRIMAKIRSLGMVIDATTGVRASFCDPGEADEFLKQFTAQIDKSKELDCRMVIMVSGKRVDSLGPAVQRQTSIENLKRAGDLAAKNDLEIVIEPIDALENPTIYLRTVSDGFEIVRAVGNPHVKVLYDMYHEQREFGNLLEKLEKNIDLVGLVHVADVPGRHEPGTGEINYTNIYRKLAELKYNRFIAMEYYPTEDPVTSLRKARIAAQEAAGSAS